jgi:hypothetical protein
MKIRKENLLSNDILLKLSRKAKKRKHESSQEASTA